MTPDEIIDKLEKRGPRPLSAWPEVQSPAAQRFNTTAPGGHG
jgi:hypothetical protein